MAAPRILIVEDDASLAEILRYNLGEAGYEVSVVSDGREGLRQARLLQPELVVLDLMLPLVSGLEICRRLRADPETGDMLILMLTAKAEESDEIVGFSMGADDYVTKPFSVKALLERVKALLRRRETTPEQREIVIAHGVTVDRVRHRALVEDRELNLTRTEFRLLECLVRQPGRAFSRNELMDAALGADALVLERTIDVHIRALRKKMGPAHENLIETVRGVGYRFKMANGGPAATAEP